MKCPRSCCPAKSLPTTEKERVFGFISPHFYNTDEEVEFAIRQAGEILNSCIYVRLTEEQSLVG